MRPQAGAIVTRWEHGSEFHLMSVSDQVERFPSPWDRARLLFGTGRDAIRAILALGMLSKGWKRLWIPAYFCQTVVQSIVETGINVRNYSAWYPGVSKDEDGPRAVPGDVVLVVNHFGLKSQSPCVIDTRNASAVLEDHTHDPWSPWAFTSKADYCIASLRKVLPIPDGAVLWSPSSLSLPEPPPLTEEHDRAAGMKLEAMKLKAEHLAGSSLDKEVYRKLFASGEKRLSGSSVSAISAWSQEQLDRFPVSAWRKIRRRNVQTLLHALSGLPWAHVLAPSDDLDSVPFSAVLLFETTEFRNFVREGLILTGVYPAILWPLDEPVLDGIPREAVGASRRMLSIHCDMRYSEQDLKRVAERISALGNVFKEKDRNACR